MSMIDSLIDELNKSADEWNESNMFELARMCRNAADTILELRGALQVASVDYRHLQAENAKLRAARDVWAENDAKLRELVRDMHTLATDYGVYVRYPYCDAWDEKLAVVEEQMRELGMEVDG